MKKPAHVFYMGERYDDKLRQVFLHGTKEISFQGSCKFVYIGRAYQVELKENDGVSISLRPNEAEGVPEVEDATAEAWRTEDAIARQRSKRDRAAARANKCGAVKRVADALRPFIGDYSHSQLRDLVEAAVDEATKERNERQRRETAARFAKAVKRFEAKQKKEKSK